MFERIDYQSPTYEVATKGSVAMLFRTTLGVGAYSGLTYIDRAWVTEGPMELIGSIVKRFGD